MVWHRVAPVKPLQVYCLATEGDNHTTTGVTSHIIIIIIIIYKIYIAPYNHNYYIAGSTNDRTLLFGPIHPIIAQQF